MARTRRHRLYVIHGSHPCVAVERALQLKGESYDISEVVPPTQVLVMRLRFGRPTVPALRFADGEKVQGSMQIMRRLDELYPTPPLYHDDPQLGERAAEAERWGDDDLQMITRRLLFASFRRNKAAMPSFQEGAKLHVPAPVTRLAAPLIIAGEWRAHRMTHEQVARDLAGLPQTFDRIDAWIDEGVLGGEQVTAADLQVASSVRLLLTLGDVRVRFGDRPAAELARRLFPAWAGDVPAGALVPA